MEDVKFHQCVRLARFENDRTISFIPPDGEFELMSYRLSTPVKPLIWVEAAVESHRGSRVEYMVKVIAQFKRRSTANNVEIYVPVPDDADSPKFRASTGSVQYAPDKSAFVWKIKQLAGGKEFLMRAHFGLPSVKNGKPAHGYVPCSKFVHRTRRREARTNNSKIRDTVFHSLWYTGPVPEDSGEKRLPGSAMGAVYYPEWR
jgi:AP-1 complex subunit mu